MTEGHGIVIVGGGPAGLSAARAYREAGGRDGVVLLSAELHAPYWRPPLTKEYLRGEFARTDLPIEPHEFYEDNAIELRTGVEVAALDPAARAVTTAEGERIPFERCLLATGSEPARLPVPGGDGDHLLSIRTIEDSERLQSQAAHDVAITVIGSGFIGCEAAVSLARRGSAVTLVSDEDLPHERRLGAEVGAILAGWLEEEGVTLRMGRAVSEIDPLGRSVTVEGGERVEGEVTVNASGHTPRLAIAEAAGLDLRAGGVACDSALRTSAEGVLAAGDIAHAHNDAAGRALRVEHWGEARTQGETAGRVMAGEDARWDHVPGFWSQLGERTLKQVAWGDGHDEVRLERAEDDSFTAWFGRGGTTVGVLTHRRDDDYERGRELVGAGGSLP